MSDLIDKQSVVDIAMCYCPDDDGCCSKADADIRELLDEIENLQAVNRWISVEDALPDAFIYVICAGEEGMAILRYNGEVWVDDAGCMYPMSAITHWMSLPEIPEPPEKEV